MPLTKRQKQRLLELSKMITSSMAVADNMEEIQLSYTSELNNVIDDIRKKYHKPVLEELQDSKPKSATRKNVELARKRRKQIEEVKEARKNYVEYTPKKDIAPDWAKILWKKIAKKCHPDRLSFQNLSSIEISKRQILFSEAKSHYHDELWGKLIHVGLQVEEFAEDLTLKEQLEYINPEYANIKDTIDRIQSSLSWQWGTNWNDLNLRINIINTVLTHQSIPQPSREEIIQIILNLEAD